MLELDLQTMIDNCQIQGGGVIDIPPGDYIAKEPVYGQANGVFEVRATGGALNVRRPTVAIRARAPAQGNYTSVKIKVSLSSLLGTKYKAALVNSQQGCEFYGLTFEPESPANERGPIGIYNRAHAARIIACSAQFFADYGGFNAGSSGDASNANNSRWDDCRMARNRIGFYNNGAETNAGRVWGMRAEANDEYGIFESGFLGQLYGHCHASGNGLANYKQSAIEGNDDADGGVSNYTAFIDCYSEGFTRCPMTSRTIVVAFGNLVNVVDGPVIRIGYNSKLRFAELKYLSSVLRTSLFAQTLSSRDALFVTKYVLESLTQLANGTLKWVPKYPESDINEWHIFDRFIDDPSPSPTWAAGTRMLARLATSWITPFLVSDERHAKGPGRPILGMPWAPSPFYFFPSKTVHVPKDGTPIEVRFDTNDLTPTRAVAGPNGTISNVGKLFVHKPFFSPRVAGTPDVIDTGWERPLLANNTPDTNTVRTFLRCATPEPNSQETFPVEIWLMGGRVES